MAENYNETPLRGSNIATYGTVSGITFYKLESEFSGDTTKNCSLTGEEVDRNFYFLRGYDIEEIYISGAPIYDYVSGNPVCGATLVIQRVEHDYDPIEIPIPYPDFEFNKTNGILTITYPNGFVKELEGFLVNRGGGDTPSILIGIKTDNTLIGCGTEQEPLGLSPLEKTGQFSVVSEYLDATSNPKSLSACTKGKGYRIVTKETVDNFGYMYPESSLELIQQRLIESGSDWRIPTKEEWDEMLNSLETEDEYRTHGGFSPATTTRQYGLIAGVALKTVDCWRTASQYEQGQDLFGMSIFPLGMKDEQSEEISTNNEKASFWCYTNESGNSFVKTFNYAFGGVNQYLPRPGYMCSIRLIKNSSATTLSDTETILGRNYKTTKITSFYNDTNYSKTWLAVNFAGNDPEFQGITTDEYSQELQEHRNSEAFYLNEWDGEQWLKKEMKNGDSVVITEKDGKRLHEWRLIDNELVDTDLTHSDIPDWSETIQNIQNNISTIENNIDTISGNTESLINDVNELSGFTSNLSQNITTTNSNLVSLSSATQTIENNLTDEINARETKDIDLQEQINAFTDSTPTIEGFSALTAVVDKLRDDVDDLGSDVDVLSGKTVKDIKYIDDRLRLEYADGTTSQGFVPNDFTKDTFVCGVTLNANTELIINMNDGVVYTVPFNNSSLDNIYHIENASKTFLHISGSEIGAYVDHGGGYMNTLATTSYVDSAKTEAITESSAYTDNRLRIVSGHIAHHISTVESQLSDKINENKDAIDLINGTINEEGSVISTFYHELDGSLLAQDVVNPDGITNADSLLRKIHLDPEEGDLARYYVSNHASDMVIIIDGEPRNLENYIKDLKLQVNNLQTQLNNLETNLTQTIKDTVKQYLVGTDYEIKLTETTNNTLKIGFTDDAIFGDITGTNPINQ